MQRAASINLRIEPDVRARAEAVAEQQHRKLAFVVRDALTQYVERCEAEQKEIQEAVASWQQYEATGLHMAGEEVAAWLDSWGTDGEQEAPQCRV
jgi:predicted transcriptional regulator